MNLTVMSTSEPLESVLEKVRALRTPPLGVFLADPTSLDHPRIDTGRIFGHKQVTDLHLINLVASSNAVLATFDRRIKEALAPQDQRYVEVIPT